MSFELYVWHEPAPISADIAEAKVRRWADEQMFTPHESVSALRAELLRRFPLSDVGKGVWDRPPNESDAVLALSCVWSRAGEFGEAVRDLAAAYGLVCYEPRSHILDPNAPGDRAAFTLTSADWPMVHDPDDDQLERAARGLGSDNFYALLERSDGHFAQVGYGASAGAPPGVYALEHRAGRDGEHVRAETPEVAEAIRFLLEFRAGEESWRTRHAWRLLSL
ncbi:hypothetical protein [Actinoplanes sp. DH11]|uniref:hypothetical protein n=1 Tax=Actinoplanes sp. DH11 TaxID=2857011 RepID=UPI001E323C9B|nr:hypothetical protein [Actinoplanes sp. DH11]